MLSRENLAAYVTVSSDPEDYGEMQVLELPSSQAVLGPGQVQGLFRSTPDIAREISLLDQRGSEVKYGNLLTLPVGGGLLYVEPLYVQAQGLPFPTLQFVLVAFGNRTAFAPTLAEALTALFGAGAGEQAPDPDTTPTPTPSGTATASPTSPTSPAPSGPAGTQSPALTAALNELSSRGQRPAGGLPQR